MNTTMKSFCEMYVERPNFLSRLVIKNLSLKVPQKLVLTILLKDEKTALFDCLEMAIW
jgi:hypothetical protein